MSCAGHGVAMPERPAHCPENTCWQCWLPFPPPFVPPPPKNCPSDFTPGAYQQGVLRNASGHITGIAWGELAGPNAHLLRFKDVAIGPGHPLAEGMNPRSFIPCARSASPVVCKPSQPPSLAPPQRGEGQAVEGGAGGGADAPAPCSAAGAE